MADRRACRVGRYDVSCWTCHYPSVHHSPYVIDTIYTQLSRETAARALSCGAGLKIYDLRFTLASIRPQRSPSVPSGPQQRLTAPPLCLRLFNPLPME